MKTLLTTIAVLIPITVSAQTTDDLLQQLYRPPSLTVPLPAPVLPQGQGYAIIERERPAPLYYPSDTYRSIKIVPLDKQGRPTQPTYTTQEWMEDTIYGNLQRNKDKNW